MFKLIGDSINITRGDTGMLQLEPALDGEPMEKGTYTAVLSAKADMDDEAYLLQKQADDNGRFFFSHDDAKDIPAGTYVYDIEIRSGEQVHTIGASKFIVKGDVTRDD